VDADGEGRVVVLGAEGRVLFVAGKLLEYPRAEAAAFFREAHARSRRLRNDSPPVAAAAAAASPALEGSRGKRGEEPRGSEWAPSPAPPRSEKPGPRLPRESSARAAAGVGAGRERAGGPSAALLAAEAAAGVPRRTLLRRVEAAGGRTALLLSAEELLLISAEAGPSDGAPAAGPSDGAPAASQRLALRAVPPRPVDPPVGPALPPPPLSGRAQISRVERAGGAVVVHARGDAPLRVALADYPLQQLFELLDDLARLIGLD
jgi:hypothetical protein